MLETAKEHALMQENYRLRQKIAALKYLVHEVPNFHIGDELVNEQRPIEDINVYRFAFWRAYEEQEKFVMIGTGTPRPRENSHPLFHYSYYCSKAMAYEAKDIPQLLGFLHEQALRKLGNAIDKMKSQALEKQAVNG